VPKKNAKTTYGALGLMIVAMLLNERPRAPMALMAPVQKTAEEAFDAAQGAIESDPVLEKLFHIRPHQKTIIHRQTKADLQIMTFDPDVLTGKKFAYALIDELHVVAKSAKAPAAIRQIRGGTVPFPEGFLAFITTMPDSEPVGVMKQELRKARDVRDGKREARTLAVLYEFPRSMQESGEWKDPKTWAMVNPNINRSVTLERLLELYTDEALKSEADLRAWASQHLNIEIGFGLRSDSWAGAEFWERRAGAAGSRSSNSSSVATSPRSASTAEASTICSGLTCIGRDRDTAKWLAGRRPGRIRSFSSGAKRSRSSCSTCRLPASSRSSKTHGRGHRRARRHRGAALHAAKLFEREDDDDENVMPAIGLDPRRRGPHPRGDQGARCPDKRSSASHRAGR
jgi:hypothetical protein